MNLLVRFRSELRNISNEAFLSFYEGLDAVEVRGGRLMESISDPSRTIGIGRDVPIAWIIEMFAKRRLQHFVQLSQPDFLYDLFASAVMLKRPSSFLQAPLPFFIHNFKEKLIKADSVRYVVLPFFTRLEKTKVLNEAEEFVMKYPRTASLREPALMIVDEFFMNAMYNSPAGSERSDEVNSDVKIFLSHDESRLLIGCEDPYGAIDRDQVLSALSHTFGGTSVTDAGVPLQGLSYKLIINNCCGFYVVVEKNKRSLLCVSIPLGGGQRGLEATPKNLHFCFF